MTFVGQPALHLRSNFAIHHLRSAAEAARDAHAVEQENPGAPHGSWFDEMIRLVPVSIVMAGAALEACANEIVQDILDSNKLGNQPIRNCQQKLLRDVKEDRAGNSTDKYRKLALIFDKEPVTGNAIWNDAGNLVAFRNYFMHFKPAWDHETAIHDSKLVNSLKPRISISPGYKESFMFPYGFMTYGCAKWSIETVLAFSAQYSQLIGVNNRFSTPHLDYSLP